jgi:ribosomal protein S18 acetylase RimI-like enzyme
MQVDSHFASRAVVRHVLLDRVLRSVLGVSVYRQYQNTYDGSKFHLEGMCTDPAYRSRGVGRAMMVSCSAIRTEDFVEAPR